MFSTEFAYTLEAAVREASNRKHMYFSVEHLLFALCHDIEVKEILFESGANIEELRSQLEDFFDDHVEQIDTRIDQEIEDSTRAESLEIPPFQTPAVQRVLQNALIHIRNAGKEIVHTKDVLVSLFSEEDSHAVYFLHEQGVTKLDVLDFISHGVAKRSFEEDIEDLDQQESGSAKKGKFLYKYTENLTELAREGQLDPVIGREAEISRALKVLARRSKNNPLFLGEPGVGKTAIAHAIAQKLADGDIPEALTSCTFFLLDVASLIAGTKYRGEFEERFKGVLKDLRDVEQPIVFIDEIHTIVGAGAVGTGSMDAANLLKPSLSSGLIRCIGSTTYEEYKKSIEKDRALARRFSTIELPEPSVEETVKMLKGHKDAFEKHHNVKYTDTALKAAAELSAKYITDRHLPDKAIDVIDEAGAANALLDHKKRKKSIAIREIEEVVSAIAKVPVRSVSGDEEETLKGLAIKLQAQVYGQDDAVESIAKAIKRQRAGIRQEGRPIGSFLFSGPTGVGKTELAKALSSILGVPFHRFDMSEYMEKHTVAKFIGAPPGYVGYDEGGQLTDLIKKHPHAVLLLDEIEKAHPDIFNILLQVMDTATLTDAQGRKADFRNVILIMTTNAGSGEAKALGFSRQGASDKQDTELKKLFKPEFRNRLDEIISFAPLPTDVMEKIVDKFILELEAQLKNRKITFKLSKQARTWLATKGFDPQLGARPMSRMIEREIKDPLTDEILFGKLKKGGTVKIDLKKEQLSFTIA